MEWQPTHLTRDQMEQRRRSGAQLLRAGQLSQAEIARRLGVSRATVSDWAKQLAQGGLRALRRRKAPGRPARLTRDDQRALRRLLRRGAMAAGFPTDRWTLRRIGQVIHMSLGCTTIPTISTVCWLGWAGACSNRCPAPASETKT